MGFAAAPHNVVRCPPLLWASLAVLLLLLNEPIKEPRFDQGLACDAAQLRSVIKLLEHVAGTTTLKRLGAKPGRVQPVLLNHAKTLSPSSKRRSASSAVIGNLFVLARSADRDESEIAGSRSGNPAFIGSYGVIVILFLVWLYIGLSLGPYNLSKSISSSSLSMRYHVYRAWNSHIQRRS